MLDGKDVMVRLIINADDLGYARVNNDAIFELMDDKKITSATLMTNADGFEDAVRRLKNYPECSFGLHLDIVEFPFITRGKGLIRKKLIDENGRVLSNIRRRHIIPDGQFLEDIFNEWCAQMDKALAANVPISHVDSHKHTHTVRYLERIFIDFCKKYDIRKVRNKNQNYEYCNDRPLLRRYWRDIKRRKWCNDISREFITPDHFEEGRSGLPYLQNHCIKEDISIEWMCHPGAKKFRDDLPRFKSDWESTLKTPIRKISFNDL